MLSWIVEPYKARNNTKFPIRSSLSIIVEDWLLQNNRPLYVAEWSGVFQSANFEYNS